MKMCIYGLYTGGRKLFNGGTAETASHTYCERERETIVKSLTEIIDIKIEYNIRVHIICAWRRNLLHFARLGNIYNNVYYSSREREVAVLKLVSKHSRRVKTHCLSC